MIQVNEYRCGNSVSYCGDCDTINAISHADHFVCLNSAGQLSVFDTDVEPIPLTPDLLLKCGLSDFQFAENFTVRMRSRQHASMLYIEQYGEGEECLPHIKYLHQLQNLYFALTGQELTVNL